ncbi:MAG: hypothetical protein A2984_01980 [Omnitrophica WOR_2 bacterium RIFCSPLOWO2_01_FULL_41_12]|nr:MAG: hypothetical protein A2984_01980 [Omnitrophica WOR_2 bacterium RIFCSPLOWO2_01_FULL_41_12]
MVSPLRQIIFLVIGFYLLLTPCSAQDTQYVRVAILQDASFLRLKINGFYEVLDALTRKVLYRGKNLNTTVTVYAGGILLGNIKSKTDKLFIKSDDPLAININGRLFRGNIQFIKMSNLGLSVINHIELEDYIKGILYHESSHYWPIEALKAQAIACRTFALYQMQENKTRDFDLTSDIYSQVYGGRTSERYRTNRAVDETKGYVVTYQGKIFSTYYHATCSGHTEDASLLWNINIMPLKGVACSFCKDSPHFSWHYVLSLDEIKDKLANAGYKISNIKNILISGKDKSGRITNLKIILNKNDLEISAKDFRNIISPNIIRSTNFNVQVVNHDAVFEGFGWGHGVGLCQWGAYFMAKLGRNYQDILKYYYPGAQISLD